MLPGGEQRVREHIAGSENVKCKIWDKEGVRSGIREFEDNMLKITNSKNGKDECINGHPFITKLRLTGVREKKCNVFPR